MTKENLKKILILLNDEDYLLLKVMRNKFSKDAGWESIITTSYDEAQKTALEEKPDIIITEIIINDPKGRTGFELIKTIKDQSNRPGLQIVIFTELRQDKDKEKAKYLGVSYFFIKSEITINQLITEVKKLVA